MKQAKKPVQKDVVQEEEVHENPEEQDGDYEPAYNEIDKLEQHGINMADITKLKGAGICTVLAVLMW